MEREEVGCAQLIVRNIHGRPADEASGGEALGYMHGTGMACLLIRGVRPN